MKVDIHISPFAALSKESVLNTLNNFNNTGSLIGTGYRNVIKDFEINGEYYNIKAFKVPNLLIKVVYSFFRKSKAERSFLYAEKLLKLGFLTPQPVAYVICKSGLFFGKSYYISKQLEYDFTIRKIIDEPISEENKNILKAFTKFTYKLHENNVHFLDHSPGNTLIKILPAGYDFYLVDLNRMNFKTLTLDERFANFARLSPKGPLLDIISKEYAILINKPHEIVRARMLFYSNKFSVSFKRKEKLKKKYFFWRKKSK